MNIPCTSLNEATRMLLSYAPVARPKSYDLSVMKQLMVVVGNPETRLRVIHVAGTSGKTSTCYYIRGLLEAAGKKTGLTVSPHITAINERVQIHGEPLDEVRFLKYLETFMGLVAATDLKPSYYELTMAFAYYVFDQEKVDYAIIETGLGGLLDGSNIAERDDKICVIQRIGYDHTEILGETLPEIALQKAGIIHENNTVFVLEQPKEINNVFVDYALAKKATIYRIKEARSDDLPIAYQQANWSMAYAVFEYLVEHDNLQQLEPSMLKDIKKQTPPGRFEIYSRENKSIILDGAHNGQKLRALIKSMQEKGIAIPVVILSLKETDDKKVDECISAVSGYCRELIITSFNVGQDARHITNVDTETMARSAATYGMKARIINDQQAALEHALQSSAETILITGSLYLVSEMRRLL